MDPLKFRKRKNEERNVSNSSHVIVICSKSPMLEKPSVILRTRTRFVSFNELSDSLCCSSQSIGNLGKNKPDTNLDLVFPSDLVVKRRDVWIFSSKSFWSSDQRRDFSDIGLVCWRLLSSGFFGLSVCGCCFLFFFVFFSFFLLLRAERTDTMTAAAAAAEEEEEKR